MDKSRRAFILAAGAMAAGLSGATAAQAASERDIGRSGIDRSCRVSSQRLDALVAKAFPLFNKPAILPAFDKKKDGARFDVDLHRIVTHTVVPETGEKLKVSGLLALPVGIKGELPLLSWQHGTILSFDQVPSNLTLLADPAYELTDAADSLETLFNVQRFAGQGYAVVAADYVGKGPFRNGRGGRLCSEGGQRPYLRRRSGGRAGRHAVARRQAVKAVPSRLVAGRAQYAVAASGVACEVPSAHGNGGRQPVQRFE